MLEYEWGNQSTMMLSGDEPTPQEQEQNRQLFDHYAAADQSFDEHNLIIPQPTTASSLFHSHHPITTHHQVNSFFDQGGYAATSTTTTTTTTGTPHPSLLSLDPAAANAGQEASYFLVPKAEDVDFTARIGLNLGGRTYFSSAEDDFVNRLYHGSRPMEAAGSNVPRCQAEGCNADLTHAKHYHRRHKVCDFHSKASSVIVSGLTRRFCQQCSRFHLLLEFDNGKRSCRRRLADHNRRRRKSHQTNQENQKAQLLENAPNSSPENLTRSPQDSGAQPSSSVTVAIPRPRMSLDCFKQRPCQANASSTSSSSLFFSGG